VSLASDALETYVAMRQLVVGLLRAGTELEGQTGYQRAPIKTWAVDGSQAIGSARFGPFMASVEFDAYALYGSEGKLVGVRPFGEVSRIRATSEYVQEIELDFRDLD
jgi:hypothetical protein